MKSNDALFGSIKFQCTEQVEHLELLFNALAHREGIDEGARRIAQRGVSLAQELHDDLGVAIEVIEADLAERDHA